MPQNIQVDLHTHIHHYLPPMTAVQPASSSTSSPRAISAELQELVALVARLSNATTEAMRLSIEVQARLPLLVAREGAAAQSVPTTLNPVAAASAPVSAPSLVAAVVAPAAAALVVSPAQAHPNSTPDYDDDDRTGPLFVRGIPATPAYVERHHPPGSGEVWYVVIRGREPGLYGTALEADHQCNGIPRQFKIKKTSRVDALNLYRSEYNGPDGDGVEKWNEVA
ncbi:hypothetical protein R3P38DRAFT_3228220 [Favolaschia claudopus]|uniref:Uncharacterized protein n=1 Tax=Favolaschia claudopus TaxID=2862362 RepID=A0AAV9ZQU2_9AGAR